MKTYRTLRLLFLLIGLAIWVFGPLIGKTAFSVKTLATEIARNLTVRSQSFGCPYTPHRLPLIDSSMMKKFEAPKSAAVVPLAKQAKKIAKGKKRQADLDRLTNGKKPKFFPAEVLAGVPETFSSVAAVDTAVWKPVYGWPTPREIKWLADKMWGDLIRALLACLKISDCYDIIVAIFNHESALSPLAINRQSGATGLGQTVFKTAKVLSAGKFKFPIDAMGFPVESINRACPEQNIFNTVILFYNNLQFFKAKGYKNCKDWATLAHYTGNGAAEDTAKFYGGIYKVPFMLAVMPLEKLKAKEAPVWAQNLWAKGDWVTVESIRQLAKGKAKKRKAIAQLATVEN